MMSPLPLWFKGLTPELLQKAERELGESPEVKARALKEFRRLIKDEKDIHSRMDDIFLLRYLRVKKFDPQKSLVTFRNYHEFRTKYAGIFTCLKPSDVKHVMSMNCLCYAPYRSPEGSHIAMFRMGSFDPNAASPEQLLATILICGELIFECEATQIAGGIIIVDFNGITLQHFTMFITFQFLKFLISKFQDCWPQRVGKIHFIRQPASLTAIYYLLKPFVKKKLQERLHFHGDNITNLQKYVPIELLPEEFGGTAGPFNNKEYASYFLSQDEYIESINKYGKIKK